MNSITSEQTAKVAEHLLEYLLNITQSKVGNMAKLGALAMFAELFQKDKVETCDIKAVSLQHGIFNSISLAIETGFSPQCDMADAVYVSVAMELLWQLSRLPVGQIQPLITENMIRRLLSFIDTDEGFFRYGEKISTEIKSLCENKHLVAKVTTVSMTAELLEYIHSHSKGHLKNMKKLPGCVKYCRLFDTSDPEKDVDVTQHLVQEGLAWSASENPEESAKGQTSNDWVDVIVTKVEDNGYFWAHVGMERIRSVCDIQKQLNQSEDLERRQGARIGETVVVEGTLKGHSCLLRGQVTGREGTIYSVFALDYGFVLTVSADQMFTIPEAFTQSKQLGKASLCSVSGIRPPPFDVSIVQNAVAILCNLCKQSITADGTLDIFSVGEILEKLGGIKKIEDLLFSSQDVGLSLQLLNLVNNLACNSRLTHSLSRSNIMKAVLECGKRPELLSEDLHFYKCWMPCLTNLMYRSRENKQKFYQEQGLDLILKVIVKEGMGHLNVIYKLAVKVLREWCGRADLAINSTQATIDRDRQAHSKDSRIFSDEPFDKRSKSRSSNSRGRIQDRVKRSRSTEPVQGRLHHRRLKQVEDSSDSEDENNLLGNGHVTSGEDTEGDFLVCRHEDTSSSPGAVIPRNTSDLFETNGTEKYVYGSAVRFCDDSTHEIRPNKSIEKLSSTVVAEHVCGMLNNGKGGTIYFGIGKDQIVKGIRLSRDDKDEFRLGVDKMMSLKLTPILLHSQFDVTYFPVVENAAEQRPIPNIYVIEICVKPSKGTVYIMKGDEKCYYRFGHNTSPINTQALRQLVIVEEEAHYEAEVQKLRAQLKSLKC